MTEIDIDNAEFQCAWQLIKSTNQSIFLTGKAGTGKSTFLRYICRNTSKKHVVLAPTGIAAVNAGGVTLHSFFRLPFKPVVPDDPEFAERRLKERMKYPRSLVKLIREVELIIIDEISMVRADTIDFIDRLLRHYTGNKREPFGGKQMLLIGDVFQLEPVVTGDMRDILSRYYPDNFFYSAKVFREIAPVAIELTKVYRQNDPKFISLLDRVRAGRPAQADLTLLNSRLLPDTAEEAADPGKMSMTLATTRASVDAINDDRLARLPSEEIVYLGEVKGDFPENALPSPLELTLKVGAQVVFIKNDPDHRWVNGTLGRVIAADDDTLRVELDTGETHSVERTIWENIRYNFDERKHTVEEETLGTYTQFPLKLAWALTVHKSQGLTFSDVVIDMGHGAFSGGQAYVALSRCRSLEGMHLKATINTRDIFVNPSVVRFSRSFNDRGLVDEALENARIATAFRAIMAHIDRGDIPEAFERFGQLTATDPLAASKLTPGLQRLVRRRLTRAAGYRKEADTLRRQLADDRERFHTLAMEYVAMGRECFKEGMELTPVIANFDKALSIAPGCIDAIIGKGEAYLGAGLAAEAVETLGEARRLLADDKKGSAKLLFPTLIMLGKAYRADGDLANALDSWIAATDINNDHAPLHLLLADLYDEVGDHEAADHHAEVVRRLRRKHK